MLPALPVQTQPAAERSWTPVAEKDGKRGTPWRAKLGEGPPCPSAASAATLPAQAGLLRLPPGPPRADPAARHSPRQRRAGQTR